MLPGMRRPRSACPDPLTRPPAYLGLDLGTSGCRGIAIDQHGYLLVERVRRLPPSRRPAAGQSEQDPDDWWQTAIGVLRDISRALAHHTPVALACDGTSSTLLVTDAEGQPLTAGLMYDDQRATVQAAQLAAIAPSDSAVHAAGSSLAKLMWLTDQLPTTAAHACHQAEWIVGRLTGSYGLGDENNCLKLGYDPVTRSWPAWLADTGVALRLMPQVYPAGNGLATLAPEVCALTGLPSHLLVTAGTTDSVAAALACDLGEVGDAATALGSTLAVKLLSSSPVFAPEFGVYSHRVLGRWLVGGASNSGGAVLRAHFTDDEMRRRETGVNPDKPTGLNYYPLLHAGERFPINDPTLAPRLAPAPTDRTVFFQAMLEGIAAIEAAGYRRLTGLGAAPLRRVVTTGGGAKNRPWRIIRQGLLGVPVETAVHEQAAYGAALLARTAVAG